MNFPDSIGESSSKRQENGDASTGSERPLKKARFAWQVKGKYHLRNETTDTNKTTAVLSNDSDGAGSSSESISNSNDLVGNTEQNLEILGDYLLKQDFNTLDSVITDPDKSLLTPSPSVTTETLPYPKYISSYYNNSNTALHITNNNENMLVSPSMVLPNIYNEDQCIARWQARQMAKGFVDNTINRVLDSWIHPPMPPDMDNSRFLALDVAEFINNLPGDNSIENEGILMAISAHGLQNTSNSSNSNTQNDPSNNKDETFLSPPSSPMQSDDEVVQDELNKSEQVRFEDHNSTSGLTWPYTEATKKGVDDALIPFSLFPDTSNSYQYFNDAGHLQSTSVEYDADDNSTGNHYDFMDAAVSFAIQNKGLTTFGTDYG